MESPEDGSPCGFVSTETWRCGGGSGPLQDSPTWGVGHSSREPVSQVETRGALTGASAKPPYAATGQQDSEERCLEPDPGVQIRP